MKHSKPIAQVKKGDFVSVDGAKYEVDAHYVLIDHGSTKEMAIELFDKKDNDYQLRYFADNVEETLEFYALVGGVMYEKREVKKIEW